MQAGCLNRQEPSASASSSSFAVSLCILFHQELPFWQVCLLATHLDLAKLLQHDDICYCCCRLRRDIVERGRSVLSVLNQYEKFVKPSFDSYILPTKQHADIIVRSLCPFYDKVLWLSDAALCSTTIGLSFSIFGVSALTQHAPPSHMRSPLIPALSLLSLPACDQFNNSKALQMFLHTWHILSITSPEQGLLGLLAHKP